jgi:hypothetical protein
LTLLQFQGRNHQKTKQNKSLATATDDVTTTPAIDVTILHYCPMRLLLLPPLVPPSSAADVVALDEDNTEEVPASPRFDTEIIMHVFGYLDAGHSQHTKSILVRPVVLIRSLVSIGGNGGAQCRR